MRPCFLARFFACRSRTMQVCAGIVSKTSTTYSVKVAYGKMYRGILHYVLRTCTQYVVWISSGLHEAMAIMGYVICRLSCTWTLARSSETAWQLSREDVFSPAW